MIRIISALLLLTIASTKAHTREIPLEEFTRHGDYLSISLSPNGDYLAARVRFDDQVALFFIDRESGETLSHIAAGKKNEVFDPQWVSEDRVIFRFAEKEHYLDAPIAKGELFGMNVDGTRGEMLAGYRASDGKMGTIISRKNNDRSSHELLHPLPQDKKHALIVEYPWTKVGNYYYDDRKKLPVISKIHIFNGKKKRLEILPFNDPHLLTTRDGEILFATYQTEDGDLQASYRTSSDSDWISLKESFELDEDMEAIALNHTGDTVYLLRAEGDEGFKNIYALNLVSKEVKPVFSDLDSDIRSWVIDPATGDIVVGVSYKDRARYYYADVNSKTISNHKKFAKAFEGQNIHLVSSTANNSHVLLRVTSDVNPGEYYYFDNNTNQASFVFANLSWIDPRDMRPMQNDVVPIDGKPTIPIRVTLPAEEVGNAPLIVLVHGGPHGTADLWRFNREVQLFANRGYAVLQVNFRGSGYFGDAHEIAGYKQWGGLVIDDIHAATQYTLEKYPIDKDKICAYGASFGGYASMMLAARYPDLLECAVGYVGVYDLSLMFKEGDIPLRWGGISYLKTVLGTDEQELRDFSPIYHADSIKAQVMLVHGNEDIRAPIEHAEAMRAALKKAGKNPQWLEFKRSGHGVWDQESRITLYTELLEFLDKNLK